MKNAYESLFFEVWFLHYFLLATYEDERETVAMLFEVKFNLERIRVSELALRMYIYIRWPHAVYEKYLIIK